MIRTNRQKHCSIALRGAIVGQHLAGSSYEAISNSLNVSIQTVKRWVYRYRNENHLTAMLRQRPQPGQVRKLNVTQRKAVVQKIIDKPSLNAAIVGREYGVNKNTIRKIWIEAKIYHRIAAKKPKLTEAQREERMGYALENLTREWSNVIFSDEKTYQTDRHQKMHLYRPNNCRYDDRYIQQTQRCGRISAGCWGWISKDGPGELTMYNGGFKGKDYVEVLDVLKPTVEICYGGFKDMVFMQDNCSIHTAKVCREWFANNPDLDCLKSPPNSPDLNPIENVWAQTTKDWVSVFPRKYSILEAQIMANWEKLREKPEYFKNLYDSMPKRINAVIDKNGGHTKY